MSYVLNVGTFNIGGGYGDYINMLIPRDGELRQIQKEYQAFAQQEVNERTDLSRDDVRRIEWNAKLKVMEDIEKRVAEHLAQELDVIHLQEVKTLKRRFVTALEAQGFKIYHLERGKKKATFSTAVALKSSLFEDCVQNISVASQSDKGSDRHIYGQEVAAVIAKIKNSCVKLAFASLHSWGFTLYSPDSTEHKIYSQNDRDQMKWGVEYTREAIQNFNHHSFDHGLMGGDMNNNPQNSREQFDLLAESGYNIWEPNEPTNINPSDVYKDRKIDFIFSRNLSFLQRIWRTVSSIFFSQIEAQISNARVLPGFDFTRTGNCSDHKPFAVTLTLRTVPSKISCLWLKLSKAINNFERGLMSIFFDRWDMYFSQ
jgi:exonuclease III